VVSIIYPSLPMTEEKKPEELLGPMRDASQDEKQPQHPEKKNKSKKAPLTLVKALLGECLCQAGAFSGFEHRSSQATQFINLHGIEFIGLGAVVDELTPKERVYDTLEQLTNRTERLISIGYLSVDDTDTIVANSKQPSSPEIRIETVPLDVWNKTYPNDQSMPKRTKRIIDNITVRTILNTLHLFVFFAAASKWNERETK